MAAPRKHPEKLRGGRSGFPQVRLTCCHVVLWDRGRPQSLLRAQPSDPPLAHDLTGPLELNSQEPVAELWAVGAAGLGLRVNRNCVGIGFGVGVSAFTPQKLRHEAGGVFGGASGRSQVTTARVSMLYWQ